MKVCDNNCVFYVNETTCDNNKVEGGPTHSKCKEYYAMKRRFGFTQYINPNSWSCGFALDLLSVYGVRWLSLTVLFWKFSIRLSDYREAVNG